MNPSDLKIAISGDLGSGKSTVCNLLRDTLGYPIFSMGETWRSLAEKYKMTILELNQYSETHPLDEEMDQIMAAKGLEPGNMIFDSRLGWHFVPHSFKIHLIVNPRVAADRIFHDQRRGEAEEYTNIEEAAAKIAARKTSENQRYLQKYRIDCANLRNYDLVVDTSTASSQEIAALIIRVMNQWRGGQPFNPFWIGPRTPFPMQSTQAPESFLAAGTISLIQIDHDFFVFQGIELLNEAFAKGLPLIPARVTACNNEIIVPPATTARQFVNQHCSFALIHEWEKRHGFKYPAYPLVE